MTKASKFFAKVYDKTGTTIRQTLASSAILNVPNIVRETGKPAASINLTVAKPWDGFGYGEADGLNLFDLVKLYAVTPANPSGVLVFQGHVTEIEAVCAAGDDHIELRIFPIDALLTMALFRQGGSFTADFTGADIDDIFTDVLAHANATFGTFFVPDLDAPGESVTVTYDQKKHSEILTAAGALLSDSWYWRIGPDGKVKLAEYAATADHTFTLGKDAEQLTLTRSILTVDNGYRLAWGSGPTYSYYSDATSQTAFGLRETAESDSGIQDSGSADVKGAAYIASHKGQRDKLSVVVNADYAIETILPGDTCQVLNTKIGALPKRIHRIVRVGYDGESAVLDLEEVNDNLGEELTKSL